MNIEPSSSRALDHFRATKRRLPLHPLEKAVLAIVAAHLCFLPWALGGMTAWSQITSLALAALGMIIALIPRTYAGDLNPGIMIGGQTADGRGPTPGNLQPTTDNNQGI